MILLANTSLTQVIKRAAMEAIVASKPCDTVVGTVARAAPLEIKISQDLVIESDFLILTRNVADYEITMKMDGTEKRTYQVFNALKKGEKVLLIRKPGGQRYIVIDRVVDG